VSVGTDRDGGRPVGAANRPEANTAMGGKKPSTVRPTPSVIVVMGVSGAGKTTIGALLAGRLQWEFADGDWFHPDSNVEKMRSGTPLTDEDRWPWLQAIAEWIDATRREGGHAIVACSTLKRSYRAVIIGDRPDVRLVYLKGDRALIAHRQAARHGHFMPTGLLESQFEALEEPGREEDAIVVSIEPRPREIIDTILGILEAQNTLPRSTG
jgi:gluconokinase